MTYISIYRVDMCPICGIRLEILVDRHSNKIIFFCDLCESSWHEKPVDHEVKELNELRKLAPNGVRLPSKKEIERLEIDSSEIQTQPIEERWEDLSFIERVDVGEDISIDDYNLYEKELIALYFEYKANNDGNSSIEEAFYLHNSKYFRGKENEYMENINEFKSKQE